VLIYFGGRIVSIPFHLPIIPVGTVSVSVLCVIQYWLTYNSKINKIHMERWWIIKL
jgi:hypothetical protein